MLHSILVALILVPAGSLVALGFTMSIVLIYPPAFSHFMPILAILTIPACTIMFALFGNPAMNILDASTPTEPRPERREPGEWVQVAENIWERKS